MQDPPRPVRVIDRRLAHLTPGRSSDFDWSNRDPLQALRPLVEDFLKRVSDERLDRGSWVYEALLLLAELSQEGE